MSEAAHLPPPFRLVALDSIDSTNDEAKRRARAGAGAAPFTVVWAGEQTAGRGRRGRPWVSPRGNLHCSFLLAPPVPLAQAAQLSFVAALALAEALAPLAPAADFRCKWPNDVLCDGRKIAGMLIETADVPGQVVLGIGVDVEHCPDPVLYPTVSLRHAGGTADAGQVLEALAASLGVWYGRWEREGFAPVRAAWLARAKGLGEAIEVRLDGETLHGTFVGLDPDGVLVVGLAGGGERRIMAGDVFFPGAR